MVEQQGEGAAAVARGNVGGADQALQQLGDVAQGGIAGDAAMAFIDRPEIVDIDRDQGGGNLVAGGLADHALQLGAELAGVGQLCQRIAAAMLFRLAQLGAGIRKRRAKQRIFVIEPLQCLARFACLGAALGALVISPCHGISLGREG